VITGKWIAMSAAALMMGSVLFAADDPMSPPADTPPATHHHARMIKPYNELSGLNDDQKAKITEIHADFLKQQKELLAKEKSDIEAVLTDDQKAELKTLEEQTASDRKEKSARQREAKDQETDAATQPVK